MSVQFGKCHFDGQTIDPKELDRVRPVLAPYGPDGEGYICKNSFGVLCRSLHTTKESQVETNPLTTESGEVITWDGRLDNRHELIGELHHYLSTESSDVSIVAVAYKCWGTAAFAKLIGDWAVSIWDPTTNCLILAKDVIGARNLYYLIENDRVTWCTILDPLIQFAKRSFALDEEYIAGCLSYFPASHLTPYVDVHSVQASSFVSFGCQAHKATKYWDFNPNKGIRYRTDAEYEEHFRSVFVTAVRRRLRSHAPVLAELSGGMDSSSIVCMADLALKQGTEETPRLDTISYFNDAEPNWNERPYFTKVEEKRGRAGFHVETSSLGLFRPELDSRTFAATPGSAGSPSEAALQTAALIASHGYRAVLSGIGGDEVLGGVPTPIPELQDLIVGGRILVLAHQLKDWALSKRKPWIHLFLASLRGFLPLDLVGVGKDARPAPWLYRDFVRRNRNALGGYKQRVRLNGTQPSFQNNLSTLEGLRRQLALQTLSAMPAREKRYPYLDRNLLEFLYSIPREQLVRPGQRRSLMRRALIGIVPDELLNRKRKAFFGRAPMLGVSENWSALRELSDHMVSSSLGIVDPAIFLKTLRAAQCGREVPIVFLMRTLGIEMWLRTLQAPECEVPETRQGRSMRQYVFRQGGRASDAVSAV